MDEGVEAIRDRLSDHFSSWYKLGIESVQDIFEVLSFLWFLRVEELKELLYELVGDKCFKTLYICSVVDD